MARLDPHSYADSDHPIARSLSWQAEVDFEARQLLAQVTLHLTGARPGPLDLDTRELSISAITDQRGEPLMFELAESDPVLGSRLRIELSEGCSAVTIAYRTSPHASALQWLAPEQTAGGKLPYLFSQCQAIHARSVLPLQDTPTHRITFDAELRVPKQLRALMAAAFVERSEQGATAVERFAMPQPIAPYLFAFAVGDLAMRELGPRSRVYSEPSVVDAAAWEFAEVDRLLDAGERLFGPYDWDRFDILVMPPSFPYGGMENPRLTFVTPTLIAGDRSQVRVIAHELAHAWTGNLVTNANAEHFWLNEGWTRYAELRITEEIEGKEEAALLSAICRQDLEAALLRFRTEGNDALSKLNPDLSGVDPDETFSVIPYDKGELLLRAIEQRVGRPRFEVFAKSYLSAFKFGSVTTQQFVAFLEQHLPGVAAEVDLQTWITQPGLPANAPASQSQLQEQVFALGQALPPEGTPWNGSQWNLYLERLEKPQTAEFCSELQRRFGFADRGDMEVRVAYLKLALSSGQAEAMGQAETVLSQVGRMKYLYPLYAAMHAHPATTADAERIYKRCRERYHPIARAVLDRKFGVASS